jgi:hypothetical protein
MRGEGAENMGEYIEIGGYQMKLGTCEDLTALRWTELDEWGHGEPIPGNSSPRAYLKWPGVFFRFPWPNEDGRTVKDAAENGGGMDSPRGPILQVPRQAPPHQHVTKCFAAPGGGYQVNVFVPCPSTLVRQVPSRHVDELEPNEAALCSALPAETGLVHIVAEKYHKGEPVGTVFRCIYCGVWFRMRKEELADTIELNRKRDDNVTGILLRLRAGVDHAD